jgi:hypothetical protein
MLIPREMAAGAGPAFRGYPILAADAQLKDQKL